MTVRMLTARDVSDWFDAYNDTFGACGRGEVPVAAVIDLYDDAMLITTATEVVGPGSEAAAAWVEAQTSAMRAAGYSHTEILSREVTILNPHTALFQADFSRRASNGEEVSAFTVTYLIYRSGDRLRIGSLALHAG